MNLIIQHYFMKQHFYLISSPCCYFLSMRCKQPTSLSFLLPVSMNWQTPDVKYIP